MKYINKWIFNILFALMFAMCFTLPVNAQDYTPRVKGLNNATYREGEKEYSTYFFLENGAYYQFNVNDALGQVVPVEKWVSSDPKVVKIVKDATNKDLCTIKAAKPGLCVLKAKLTDDFYYEFPLYVIEGFVIPQKKVEVQVGKQTEVSAYSVIAPSNYWKVSVEDPSIAKVSRKYSTVEDSYSGMHIKIKGLKTGKTVVHFTNTASHVDRKMTVRVKKHVKYPKSEDYANAVKRALVIGEVYDGSDIPLYSCENDKNAMEQMLKQTGYSEVTALQEVSKKQILKSIKETFKDATENDISLINYSGHGGEDGSIYGFRNNKLETITPQELYNVVNQIPGKVVLIFDCCFSGNYTSEDLQVKGNKEVDVKAFNQSIIQTFSEKHQVVQRGGFRTEKYHILTACTAKQASLCTNEYGIFTKTLLDGVGYDYFTGEKLSKAKADVNKDKMLSLDECADYTSLYAYAAEQNSTCYPENSGFVLFK